MVVRYQGGGNAGHTVINDMGKFALHLLPSGVFRPGVMNILGNGVALDCENLVTEMETIRAAGVSISPENLMVSHRASLLLPWHRELDALEEARLKDKMYGSTKQGIAPFYSDKYQKKTIQAGELLYPDRLMAHLQDLLEWKNLILQKVYGAKGYTMAEMTAWLETYAAQVRPYVADTGRYLRQAQAAGKAILFEGQLGALRDLDYGIYPYTTSSNTIAAYAPIGAGLPTAKIDEVVGVVKAYSSCVGEGPFTCEWFGADAEKLREAGAEYGAKTGRQPVAHRTASRGAIRLRICTVVPFPGTDRTTNRSVKLSIIVKPMPLRSLPPVVYMGRRACSTFSIPRPQSRIVISSIPPFNIFSFITTLPN